MTAPVESQSYRFFFDQHVSKPALLQLRRRGVDIVHASEVGLDRADDPDIFLWAISERRIVVTRNYRDFAPLVNAYAGRKEPFPGVLFLPSSIREGDIGGHVRALKLWIENAVTVGGNPIQNSFGWLS